MRRFSIRGLMVFVVVSAVGLAALKNANSTWAGLVLSVTLIVIGIATLGAANLRGRARSWWGGFAVFGGGYLVLAFAPGFVDQVQPKLVTSQMLGYVHSLVTASPPVAGSDESTQLARLQLQKKIQIFTSVSRAKENDAFIDILREKLAKMDQVAGLSQAATDPATVSFAS